MHWETLWRAKQLKHRWFSLTKDIHSLMSRMFGRSIRNQHDRNHPQLPPISDRFSTNYIIL